MKDFLEQINDAIAPITRAWKEIELVRITVDHEGFGVDNENDLVVDIRAKLKK